MEVPESFYDWCMRTNLESRGAALAVRHEKGDLSFAELDLHVRRREAALRRHGIGRDSIAALRFKPQIELALTMLALARIGTPFLVLPRSLTRGLIMQWIMPARATVVLTDTTDCGLDTEQGIAAEGLPVFRLSAATDPDPQPAPADPQPIPDDAPMVIIGGSGSTGHSKLIPVTGPQMRNRVLDTIETLGLTERDRSFGLVHLEYASAMHRFLAVLKSGGSALLAALHDRHWLEVIQRQAVTVVSATAIHARALLAYAGGSPGPKLPGVRLMTLAGSTIDETLRQQVMSVLTENLWIGYGTNECWYATIASPQMIRSTPGTIGVPSSRSELRLVDASGQPVADGEVGAIEIRGASVVSGYLDPALPENAAFRNGWFRPGDLGRRTADGQIVFCGRADNLMIYNGINIYPAEIENCLLAFPGVAEAVAFPARHAIHQNVPLCAVAFSAGAAPDLQQLEKHLKQCLGLRAPRRIYVLEALPRTAHGKVSVHEVIRLIRQGEARVA